MYRTGPVHRRRLRIQIVLPVRFQVLGWERRILSGSSPVLHGREPLRFPSLDELLTTKCIRKNGEIHNQKVARGIFLISSFNLYASFALLGVVRFTHSTVSIGAAWIAKYVAGNRQHTCVHRCITSTRHSRAPTRSSSLFPSAESHIALFK